jgi:two-component system sensor histidine kinase SenX3
VTTSSVAVVSAALGLLIGASAVLLVRLSDRAQRRIPDRAVLEPVVPGTVADVLAVLRSSGIIVDSSDAVVNNSPPAVAHGLIRDGELVHAELRELARQVRRDGVIREADLDLARGPLGRGRITVEARVAPLGSKHVLLLVEDRTHARRVEEVRRDFVENVSHELKTPVGGLALLAEAVLGARDDPEAVARFAGRMKVESQRLTQLVQEIVELSRLQGADTLHAPDLVDLVVAARQAVEDTRLVAESRGIEIVVGDATAADAEALVYGDNDLLTTAIRNLVGNAVNYSERGTRVVVDVRRSGSLVEATVSDQGRGIAEVDQERIFERFYRVDPARSRSTGGTGLGLAIVKHVCANHGGEVTVWSREHEGSTFTIRLPGADTGRPPSGAGSSAAARRTGGEVGR